MYSYSYTITHSQDTYAHAWPYTHLHTCTHKREHAHPCLHTYIMFMHAGRYVHVYAHSHTHTQFVFYFCRYLLHKGPEDSKCISEQRQHHQSWGFWNFQDDDNSSPSPDCARYTILYQPRDGKRQLSFLEIAVELQSYKNL
jgi:hypothetical protein